MYVEIYNTGNFKILDFLKVYDSENLEEIRVDENEPISITTYIKNHEKSSLSLIRRIIDTISLKPGFGGISSDIKSLFKRNKPI